MALASGAEAAIIYRLRAPYLPGLVDAVHGIVLGTPAWQVFQSRVLGPYLMQLVAMLSGGDFRFAYLVVMAAAIVAKDLATYVAIRRFKGTLGAILPTLAGMALFVLLQDTWIYPWDPIDGAVSAAIIYVAAGEGSAVMLAVAYVVALLNRESSLYVGLYLAIEAVVRPARSALAPFAVRLGGPPGASSCAAGDDRLDRRHLYPAPCAAGARSRDRRGCRCRLGAVRTRPAGLAL